MAVALDAVSSNSGETPSASSASNTLLTIGGSATALLGMFSSDSSSAPTGMTMTWAGASMTLIGAVDNTANGAYMAFFGLVNPTTGNQTLAASWTGTCDSYLLGMSFTGTDTSSVANAFKNFNELISASGTSETITLTGATGNMSVCGAAVNGADQITGLSTTGSSNQFIGGAYNYFSIANAPSASSVTWTCTDNTATVMGLIGVDVSVPVSVNYAFRRRTRIYIRA